MASDKIHYLALSGVEERIESLQKERQRVDTELKEALAQGDLRENSEYDAAKAEMQRIVKELDELLPARKLQPIKASLNERSITEGCVVHLTVFSLTSSPVQNVEEEFKKADSYKFDGTLMYGGTLPTQDIINDRALAIDTPIGMQIYGRYPGYYSVPVPGGFANIRVEKLNREFTPEELHACKIDMPEPV